MDISYGRGERTADFVLFRSGMLDASICACPHSTEPLLRSTVLRPHHIKNHPFGWMFHMVGVRGLEPPTPASQTRCASQLRYVP